MDPHPEEGLVSQTAVKRICGLSGVHLLFLALILEFLIVGFYLGGAKANAAILYQQPRPEKFPESSEEILTQIQVRSDVSSETVRPGGILTYTISYTNTLTYDVPNIIIENSISLGQIFNGQYSSNPEIPVEQYYFDPQGSSETGYYLKWTFPFLPASSAGTIVMTTTVLTAPEPSALTGILLVGNISAISGSGVTGNSNESVSMVVGPILTITKSDAPDPVMPGRLLTYTLTATNQDRTDSIAASNLVISDTLPENTVYEFASHDGVYDSETNTVVWSNIESLARGEALSRDLVVRVTDQISAKAKLKNLQSVYHVRSDELTVADVDGDVDVETIIDTLFTKTAVAQRMSSTSALAWPGDLVTYTLAIHNPLNTELTQVLVTDTLPGTPMPFEYVSPAHGSPEPAIMNDGRDLVWLVDLPAWGSTTRSFVVRVPAQTFIRDNRIDETLYNTANASHPDTYFTSNTSLAPVKVEAPLTMNKTVTPSHGMEGEIVSYTISLSNRGPYLVNGIRLTDTIDGSFYFLDMVSGPEPLAEFRSNPIVWSDLSVAPGQKLDLSFRAVIQGDWLKTYYNDLSASSPVVYIPSRINQAPVKVDPPIGITKTVNPTSAYKGSDVTYEISVTNYGDETWVMDMIRDTLPSGFYQVGGNWGNPAIIDFDPPFHLVPGDTWTDQFVARIVDVDCRFLPVTHYNRPEYVQIDMIEPEVVTVVNAQYLAPLRVEPNVQVDLIPYRRYLQVGELFTYTLHLNNVSNTAAMGSNISLTLHADTTYLNTLSGEAPAVNGNILTWNPIDIPALSEKTIIFSVKVKETATLGSKTPSWIKSSPDACIGNLASGDHPIGNGRIYVVENVIELTKTAQQFPVFAPLSLVEYEIAFKNTDYYEFTLPLVTDTMPPGFTYFDMVSGPPPTTIEGDKLIWQNATISAGGLYGTTTKWKIRLQTSNLYQTALNTIAVNSPETIIPASTAGIVVGPVFDLKKDVGVDSTLPGGIVPYTITLVNQSAVDYTNLRITDTLPVGFEFYRTRSGVSPIQLGPEMAQPVWVITKLTKGSTYQLAFDARVRFSVVPGTYLNAVIGTSPDGSVPGPILTAPVTILSPIHLYLPMITK